MNDGLKKYKVNHKKGAKKGLIAVLLIILIAGGIYAFFAGDILSKFSGKISSNVIVDSCREDDGGNNPDAKGIVSSVINGVSYNYTDSCLGNGNITEYYCDRSVLKIQNLTCSGGKKCNNGACVNSATNVSTNTSAITNPPLPPLTATVSVSGTTATLSWSIVAGAISYIYKRYDKGVYCCQIIRSAALPTSVSNVVPAGENYYYELFAVSASGTSIAKRTNNFTIISNTTEQDDNQDNDDNDDTNTPSSSTTPSCTSKTCTANYPNQCGASLSNGCGGTLNCASNCPADKTCVSGTCIIPLNDSCADSESGQNTSFKGTISEVLNSISSSYDDSCTNSSFVLEYYCNGTAKAFADLLCSANTTCSNGVCTIPVASIPPTPDSCTDSESGQNISFKGTVSEVLNNVSSSYDDLCATNSSFVLEYYCNGTAKTFSDLLCPANTTCTAGICA